MKLKAVNIQNFRSIQEVTLEECGDFNVIVGKNNVGKSNILYAISFFFNFLKALTKGNDPDYKFLGIPTSFSSLDFHQKLVEIPIKITMFFQLSLDEKNSLIGERIKSVKHFRDIDEFDSELSLALVLEIKNYLEEDVSEFFPPGPFTYVKKVVLCKSDCSTVQEDTIIDTIFEVNTREQQIFFPGYVFNLIKEICETKFLYLAERREPMGKCEAEQLLNLKIKRESSKKFHAVREIVTTLLDVDIDAFQADKTSSGEGSEAELDVDGFLAQVNGTGICEALRLILEYELKQPDILLVEEPEIHLHPALETIMMRYLKSIGKKCQIFITTHSTNFLDTTEMRNVYLTSREGREGSTDIQLINREEAEESIPQELGIRLSSLFMYDRLVFVEGRIDEDVIRNWAFICGVNLVQASVGFIHMDGVRNFTHYARKNTIEFLCKRRVSVFFMIDRDEKEHDDIEKLFEQLGDRKRLRILNKRQLENYLLCPRAIVEFIKEKYRLGEEWQKNVDLTEIEKAIDRCADKLKDVAIKNRVEKEVDDIIYSRPNAKSDPTIPWVERLKNKVTNQNQKLTELLEDNLEKIIQEKTTLVETKWKDSKLDIVPGDKLLEDLCESLGRQFNKKTDSAKLASHMKKNEIDLEIREILEIFTS
jgi:predicted ATP-dependent endonuclease of OLD family